MMLPKKALRIKFRSEEAVKKALKIKTFRNLTKDKIMQFASMIPYMDKEVAMAIIDQFPEFVGFAEVAIETYRMCCQNILEQNANSSAAVITGYQTILDGLSKRLQMESITEQERKSITEDMMACAKEIAIQDEKNKKFLLEMTGKIGLGVLALAGIVGSAIGFISQLGGNGELPQLEDGDTKNDDDDIIDVDYSDVE